MVAINYYGKTFPSIKECAKYFDINYGKLLYLSRKKQLSFNKSITALLMERINKTSLDEIINKNLLTNKTYLKKIANYIDSLEPPKIKRTYSRMNIPFYYDGILYSSVREYCQKNDIKYMRFMQYKRRHNCSIESTIANMQKLDKEKDCKAIMEKFHITEYSYKKLESKYGDKFYYYLKMLIRNNWQDKFKVISLSLFIDLAIKKNIQEEDIPNLFEFIKENKLKRKVLYRENLYSYNGVYDTSLHALCDKLGVCFSTVRKRMATMSYQDAIKYAMEKTRKYTYNGKTYHGFSNLCKDYNIELETITKLSLNKNISKMDAFLKMVGEKHA